MNGAVNSLGMGVNASGSGYSQALEIISRVSGKYPGGKLPGKVEIWIDGQVVTYP